MNRPLPFSAISLPFSNAMRPPTIVRSILVPSGMALLGRANWYLPRWLDWLPDLRVEGAARRDATPAAMPSGDD